MQKVAAYLLERETGLATAAHPNVERGRTIEVLNSWLDQKAREETSPDSGVFVSQWPGAEAGYKWSRAADGNRTWDLLTLGETTAEGISFETHISITKSDGSLLVYATLAAGFAELGLAHVPLDPRCPLFVRTLLSQAEDWYHGRTKIQRLQVLEGREAGAWLASEIRATERTLPIIVVSDVVHELCFARLAQDLERDLSAVANVFQVDEGAAWGVTSDFGKGFSCFGGAVRLYWPRFSREDSLFSHPLWTANRLLGQGGTPSEIRQRIRRQLRRLIFRASVIGVARPPIIDEIRGASTRRAIARLKGQADSLADYRDLAESYCEENDRLRDDKAHLERELDELRNQVRRLSWRSGRTAEEPDDIPPVDLESPAEDKIERGEIIYYKKIRSTPGHDVLVRRGDCGHGKWESANKADKAKKGIEKHEGRGDWESIVHCAKCTGGGVWKVTW